MTSMSECKEMSSESKVTESSTRETTSETKIVESSQSSSKEVASDAKLQFSTAYTTASASSEAALVEDKDFGAIQDEDLLRKMWQQTEDFNMKKKIRGRMYKLREQRLREFYTSGDVLGDILNQAIPQAEYSQHMEFEGDDGDNNSMEVSYSLGGRLSLSSSTSSIDRKRGLEMEGESPEKRERKKSGDTQVTIITETVPRKISGDGQTVIITEKTQRKKSGDGGTVIVTEKTQRKKSGDAAQAAIITEKIQRKSLDRGKRLQEVQGAPGCTVVEVTTTTTQLPPEVTMSSQSQQTGSSSYAVHTSKTSGGSYTTVETREVRDGTGPTIVEVTENRTTSPIQPSGGTCYQEVRTTSPTHPAGITYYQYQETHYTPPAVTTEVVIGPKIVEIESTDRRESNVTATESTTQQVSETVDKKTVDTTCIDTRVVEKQPVVTHPPEVVDKRRFSEIYRPFTIPGPVPERATSPRAVSPKSRLPRVSGKKSDDSPTQSPIKKPTSETPKKKQPVTKRSKSDEVPRPKGPQSPRRVPDDPRGVRSQILTVRVPASKRRGATEQDMEDSIMEELGRLDTYLSQRGEKMKVIGMDYEAMKQRHSKKQVKPRSPERPGQRTTSTETRKVVTCTTKLQRTVPDVADDSPIVTEDDVPEQEVPDSAEEGRVPVVEPPLKKRYMYPVGGEDETDKPTPTGEIDTIATLEDEIITDEEPAKERKVPLRPTMQKVPDILSRPSRLGRNDKPTTTALVTTKPRDDVVVTVKRRHLEGRTLSDKTIRDKQPVTKRVQSDTALKPNQRAKPSYASPTKPDPIRKSSKPSQPKTRGYSPPRRDSGQQYSPITSPTRSPEREVRPSAKLPSRTSPLGSPGRDDSRLKYVPGRASSPRASPVRDTKIPFRSRESTSRQQGTSPERSYPRSTRLPEGDGRPKPSTTRPSAKPADRSSPVRPTGVIQNGVCSPARSSPSPERVSPRSSPVRDGKEPSSPRMSPVDMDVEEPTQQPDYTSDEEPRDRVPSSPPMYDTDEYRREEALKEYVMTSKVTTVTSTIDTPKDSEDEAKPAKTDARPSGPSSRKPSKESPRPGDEYTTRGKSAPKSSDIKPERKAPWESPRSSLKTTKPVREPTPTVDYTKRDTKPGRRPSDEKSPTKPGRRPSDERTAMKPGRRPSDEKSPTKPGRTDSSSSLKRAPRADQPKLKHGDAKPDVPCWRTEKEKLEPTTYELVDNMKESEYIKEVVCEDVRDSDTADEKEVTTEETRVKYRMQYPDGASDTDTPTIHETSKTSYLTTLTASQETRPLKGYPEEHFPKSEDEEPSDVTSVRKKKALFETLGTTTTSPQSRPVPRESDKAKVSQKSAYFEAKAKGEYVPGSDEDIRPSDDDDNKPDDGRYATSETVQSSTTYRKDYSVEKWPEERERPKYGMKKPDAPQESPSWGTDEPTTRDDLEDRKPWDRKPDEKPSPGKPRAVLPSHKRQSDDWNQPTKVSPVKSDTKRRPSSPDMDKSGRKPEDKSQDRSYNKPWLQGKAKRPSSPEAPKSERPISKPQERSERKYDKPWARPSKVAPETTAKPKPRDTERPRSPVSSKPRSTSPDDGSPVRTRPQTKRVSSPVSDRPRGERTYDKPWSVRPKSPFRDEPLSRSIEDFPVKITDENWIRSREGTPDRGRSTPDLYRPRSISPTFDEPKWRRTPDRRSPTPELKKSSYRPSPDRDTYVRESTKPFRPERSPSPEDDKKQPTVVRRTSSKGLIGAKVEAFVSRVEKSQKSLFKSDVETCDTRIEDIEDLQLLEAMLERAKSYDDRRRIRAQIRLIRRKIYPDAEGTPTSILQTHTYETPYSPEVSRKPYSPGPTRKLSPESSRRPYSPEGRRSPPYYESRRPSSPEATKKAPKYPEPATTRRPSSPTSARRISPEARRPSSPTATRKISPETRRPSSPTETRKPRTYPEPTRKISPEATRRPSSPTETRKPRTYEPARKISPEATRRRPSSPETARRRPSSPETTRRRPSSPEASKRRPSSPEANKRRPYSPDSTRRRPSSPEVSRRRPSSPLAPAATSSPTPADTRRGSRPYYSPSPSPPTSRKASKSSPERDISPKRSYRPDYMIDTTVRRSSRTEKTVTTKGRTPIKEPSSPTRKPYPEPQNPKGKSPQMTSQHSQRLPEQPRDTTDITSSYGVGPTDDNGMPLFGLSALRKKNTRDQPDSYGLASTSLLLNGYSNKTRDSGPTDSSGKPLFGLRAITRQSESPAREKSPPDVREYRDEPQYIIAERSQPLKTIIQSHEKVVSSKSYRSDWEGEQPLSPTTVRKRSQPFQDIVHRHEEQVRRMSSSPPSSPTLKPKAKLRDTFLRSVPDEGSDLEERPQDFKANRERARALRDIIQRHEERTGSTQTPISQRKDYVRMHSTDEENGVFSDSEPEDSTSPNNTVIPMRSRPLHNIIQMHENLTAADAPIPQQNGTHHHRDSSPEVREHRMATTSVRKSSSPSPPPSDDSTSSPRRHSAGQRRSPSPDMTHRGGSPQTMEVSDQTYYSSRRYREMSPPVYSGKVSIKRDVVKSETRVKSGEEPVTKTTRAEYRYKWPPDESVGHSTRKVTASVEVGGRKVLEEEEEEEQPIKRTSSGFSRGRVGGGSVRALSKKFQEVGELANSELPKSRPYPKAGLIFRSSSFRNSDSESTPINGRAQNGDYYSYTEGTKTSRTERTSPSRKKSPERSPIRRRTPSPGKGRVQPSVSMEVRCGSPKGSRSPSPPSKSFLEDRNPVTGVQDVVRRMRASDTVIREGESDSDREARSLLNKFLGAQVLMQGIEPILKSQRVPINGDDDDNSAPLTRSTNDKGSRMQREVRNVRYGRSDDGGKTWDTKGYTATKVTMGDTILINGININEILDDKLLREMLDQCDEYEDRRKIRARIKAVTGGRKGEMIDSDSQSEDIRSISKDGRRTSSPGRDTSSSASYNTSVQGELIPFIFDQLRTSLDEAVQRNHERKTRFGPETDLPNETSMPSVASSASSSSASYSSVAAVPCNNNDPAPGGQSPEVQPEGTNNNGEECLFDSGTESGEDYSRQQSFSGEFSNFMEGLRFSLEEAAKRKQGSRGSRAESAVPPSEAGCSGALIEEVNSVLSKLRTSLQGTVSSRRASGAGLKPGDLGTESFDMSQKEELIALISRLQTSLQGAAPIEDSNRVSDDIAPIVASPAIRSSLSSSASSIPGSPNGVTMGSLTFTVNPGKDTGTVLRVDELKRALNEGMAQQGDSNAPASTSTPKKSGSPDEAARPQDNVNKSSSSSGSSRAPRKDSSQEPWKIRAARKRQNRPHTIGVSREELEEARRVMKEEAIRKAMMDDKEVDQADPLEKKQVALKEKSQTESEQPDDKTNFPILKQKSLSDLYNPAPKLYKPALFGGVYNSSPKPFTSSYSFHYDKPAVLHKPVITDLKDSFSSSGSISTSISSRGPPVYRNEDVKPASRRDEVDVSDREDEDDDDEEEEEVNLQQVHMTLPAKPRDILQVVGKSDRRDVQQQYYDRSGGVISQPVPNKFDSVNQHQRNYEPRVEHRQYGTRPAVENSDSRVSQYCNRSSATVENEQAVLGYSTILRETTVPDESNLPHTLLNGNTRKRQEPWDMDDPSKILFTPAQNVQIAVHKAAIMKQLSGEENRFHRSVEDDDDVSETSSVASMEVATISNGSMKHQGEQDYVSAFVRTSQGNYNNLPHRCNGNQVNGYNSYSNGYTDSKNLLNSVTNGDTRNGVSDAHNFSSESNSSGSGKYESRIANGYEKKDNKYKNKAEKKKKIKRANTIDIPKPMDYIQYDDDECSDSETQGQMWPVKSGSTIFDVEDLKKAMEQKSSKANSMMFTPKTDNDRKFLAFLDKHRSTVVQPAFAGVGKENKQASNWTSRFSHLKTSFESTNQQQPSSPQSPSTAPKPDSRFQKPRTPSSTETPRPGSTTAINAAAAVSVSAKKSFFEAKEVVKPKNEPPGKLPWAPSTAVQRKCPMVKSEPPAPPGGVHMVTATASAMAALQKNTPPPPPPPPILKKPLVTTGYTRHGSIAPTTTASTPSTPVGVVPGVSTRTRCQSFDSGVPSKSIMAAGPSSFKTSTPQSHPMPQSPQQIPQRPLLQQPSHLQQQQVHQIPSQQQQSAPKKPQLHQQQQIYPQPQQQIISQQHIQQHQTHQQQQQPQIHQQHQVAQQQQLYQHQQVHQSQPQAPYKPVKAGGCFNTFVETMIPSQPAPPTRTTPLPWLKEDPTSGRMTPDSSRVQSSAAKFESALRRDKAPSAPSSRPGSRRNSLSEDGIVFSAMAKIFGGSIQQNTIVAQSKPGSTSERTTPLPWLKEDSNTVVADGRVQSSAAKFENLFASAASSRRSSIQEDEPILFTAVTKVMGGPTQQRAVVNKKEVRHAGEDDDRTKSKAVINLSSVLGKLSADEDKDTSSESLSKSDSSAKRQVATESPRSDHSPIAKPIGEVYPQLHLRDRSKDTSPQRPQRPVETTAAPRQEIRASQQPRVEETRVSPRQQSAESSKPLSSYREKHQPTPERIPERVPERLPDRIPDRIPERIPERIADRIPERKPGERHQSSMPYSSELLYEKPIPPILPEGRNSPRQLVKEIEKPKTSSPTLVTYRTKPDVPPRKYAPSITSPNVTPAYQQPRLPEPSSHPVAQVTPTQTRVQPSRAKEPEPPVLSTVQPPPQARIKTGAERPVSMYINGSEQSSVVPRTIPPSSPGHQRKVRPLSVFVKPSEETWTKDESAKPPPPPSSISKAYFPKQFEARLSPERACKKRKEVEAYFKHENPITRQASESSIFRKERYREESRSMMSSSRTASYKEDKNLLEAEQTTKLQQRQRTLSEGNLDVTEDLDDYDDIDEVFETLFSANTLSKKRGAKTASRMSTESKGHAMSKSKSMEDSRAAIAASSAGASGSRRLVPPSSSASSTARSSPEPPVTHSPHFQQRQQAWEESIGVKRMMGQKLSNVAIVQQWLRNFLPQYLQTNGRSETTTTKSSSRGSPSQGDYQVKRSSYSVTSSQTTSSSSKAGMQSRAPTSPFAKFKQMDEKTSQSSPSTPCTPQTPGGKSGPIFKFTDQGVSRSTSGVKDMLLYWCQCRTRDYQNVKIENFSTSWNDGMAFCALIHHFYPDAFDFNSLNPKNRRRNFQLAFQVADEKAGIAPLLDVDDMVAMQKPDWKCVFTYVQSIYQKLKDS